MLKTIPAVAALLVAGTLVLPTVSLAAESNSVRVSYADLNLASDAGANVLQRRIAFAARVVCEFEDSRQIPLEKAANLCRNDAIQGATPAYEQAVAAARHGTVTVGGAAALIVTAR
ncbi:UrcA family protein [Sphingomonas segetis]|jgi:UrcA family protein|uniref:UrcA family protein n=1 Tax=Sphingomonas segetis TaxID=1104779 RepID=UPI0012D2A199|nr:UrcA family protein [Sphingomonas segetis]HET7606115.1 UrcA family protein [Sphingomicrobium sp.]